MRIAILKATSVGISVAQLSARGLRRTASGIESSDVLQPGQVKPPSTTRSSSSAASARSFPFLDAPRTVNSPSSSVQPSNGSCSAGSRSLDCAESRFAVLSGPSSCSAGGSAAKSCVFGRSASSASHSSSSRTNRLTSLGPALAAEGDSATTSTSSSSVESSKSTVPRLRLSSTNVFLRFLPLTALAFFPFAEAGLAAFALPLPDVLGVPPAPSLGLLAFFAFFFADPNSAPSALFAPRLAGVVDRRNCSRVAGIERERVGQAARPGAVGERVFPARVPVCSPAAQQACPRGE